MTWFAFQGMNAGKAVDLAGVQEKDAVAVGFHGYATEAEAEAKPNAVNPVTGKIADLYISDYKAAKAEDAQPGGKNASNPVAAGAQGAESAAASAAATAAKDALNSTGIPQDIKSVEQFLTGLTSANLWIRVSKVIGGGAILLVGLMKLTGADQKAGSIAAAAVKAAPLL